MVQPIPNKRKGRLGELDMMIGVLTRAKSLTPEDREKLDRLWEEITELEKQQRQEDKKRK